MLPLKIAHRGDHSRHVENTLEAFRSAYDSGCHMVELDVQLSRDGIPVIFHDDTLRRLGGRSESIWQMDADELAEIPLSDGGRWWWLRKANPRASGVGRIPTLQAFLEEHSGKPLYLEVKIPRAKSRDEGYLRALGDAVEEMLNRHPTHPDTLCASFHEKVVRRLLDGRHDYRVALIIDKMAGLRTFLSLCQAHPRLELSLPLEVLPRAIKLCEKEHMAGICERIYVWKVRSPEEVERLWRSGVRALVSDCLLWPDQKSVK